MASNGLQSYWDLTLIPYEQIIAYYDFSQTSGNIIQNVPWAVSGYNGYLNSVGSFYSNSGSGSFNGSQYVKISGSVSQTDWTSIICYEKQNNSAQILFSSLENGAGASGFVVGITNSNKLFMEYYNSVEGIQSVISPVILGTKNILTINKADNGINLNYFNPNSKLLEVAGFIPYGNNFVDSSTWYIGGSPSLPSFYSGVSNLSGKIDEFFLTSGILLNEYVEFLCSGFYSFLNTGYTVSGSCSDITFTTGTLQTIGTGITGYQSYISNTIVDPCGNTLYLFGSSGISGDISGYVYSTYTGTECIDITGFYDSGYYINYEFLSSLGMNDITFLYDTSVLDNVYYEGISGDVLRSPNNFVPPLHSVSQKYYTINNVVYTPSLFSLFYNGQLLTNLGGYSFPNGYATDYFVSGDYLLTGQYIIDSGFFDRTKARALIYDIDNYNVAVYETGTLTSGMSLGINLNNKNVFVNGVKMLSGVDYTGNSFVFNLSGSNTLTTISTSGIYNVYTGVGTGQYGFNGKFLRGSSRVFTNGIRQYLGYDYVESSFHDLLSGDFLNSSGSQIYSTDGDFWQISL
jgi:hypothetical protein